KRYRRQDAIGTPYCCTIDNHTLEKNIVSIRDRDSLNQEFQIYVCPVLFLKILGVQVSYAVVKVSYRANHGFSGHEVDDGGDREDEDGEEEVDEVLVGFGEKNFPVSFVNQKLQAHI
ncbi:MAG: His/Gly/Thr/Pro-type tRNA ligase C-terminal domain-containing protein, partial [Sweet potato little leaf phytoplasma]|nr:His/Gly/Thr/Pro-type tRNA ligase C-terminal domain-containing protein [Sweet potato little leaf phytoplasma]